MPVCSTGFGTFSIGMPSLSTSFSHRRERFFLALFSLGLPAAQIKDHAANDEEACTEAAQMGPVGDVVAMRSFIHAHERRQSIAAKTRGR